MDRIDVMRLFTRIVDLGSFTAAAEDIDLPRATATHALKQLEARLGVRLLHRTTRHVSPTLEGQAYYERCRRVLNEIEEAESFLGAARSQPSGRLRVDMSGAIATNFLLPHLGEFCRRYPGIELEIGTTNRLVDLVREGVDCVVRAGEPRDAGLVSRRVALASTVTCASRAYVEEHGVLVNPLFQDGYTSIGCEPCTRRTLPGEDPRAGRWAGFAKTECGLHT